MLPGQPPLFQLYKYFGLTAGGEISVIPVAGAPSLEAARAAAKHLGLTRYLITVTIALESTIPVDLPLDLPTPKQ